MSCKTLFSKVFQNLKEPYGKYIKYMGTWYHVMIHSVGHLYLKTQKIRSMFYIIYKISYDPCLTNKIHISHVIHILTLIWVGPLGFRFEVEGVKLPPLSKTG